MEVVKNLSISEDGAMYLAVSSAKVCYIVCPDGSVLTSTLGVISTTWGGTAGQVSLVIPKGEPLNISNSDFTGTLKTNATVINASGCNFTAKQIGDFLIYISKLHPTAIGTANFSGGLNAIFDDIAAYLLTIGIILDDLMTILSTWTVTFNEA